MTAEPSSIRVTILGESFPIQSEADEEYTRRVAGHVDATLRSLRKGKPSLEPFPTAVLGAMEITSDLFRTREGSATLAQETVVRMNRMVEAIDRALEKEASLTDGDTG